MQAMNVQKKLGYVEDFNVWTSLSVADSPNVWITVQYKDLASMQPTEEKNKAVEGELECFELVLVFCSHVAVVFL